MSIFSRSYEESRGKFLSLKAEIERHWPVAQFKSKGIDTYEDNEGSKGLSVDIIQGVPERKEKEIIITSGVHGIEGYVGAALINYFVKEFLDELNPTNTGITLVHAVNPWGMKYRRRVNQNNVDLNRNFICNWVEHKSDINKYYSELKNFLQPGKEVKKYKGLFPSFYWNTLKSLIKIGSSDLKRATLLGQYQYPQGIYYGGDNYQESTSQMIDSS